MEEAKSGFEKIEESRQCPFFNNLFPGCRGTDMRSIKIEEVIYYCGTNYGKCNIYKSLKDNGWRLH